MKKTEISNQFNEQKHIPLKIAFLGAGNMAEALVKGLLSAGLVNKEQITVSDIRKERIDYFSNVLKIQSVADNKKIIEDRDIIFISVKPQNIEEVLEEISKLVKASQHVISIVAGITTKYIESKFKEKVPVIRAMPNTPALIGAGMTAICRGRFATDAQLELAKKIFNAVGKTVVVEESLIDAITGLSGSGPAYVFAIIEALVEAGVEVGLSEEEALPLVTQTVFGAAKLLLETGESPAILREKVTSPGGTTAAGLKVFEQTDLRKIIKDAVKAAVARAKELSK